MYTHQVLGSNSCMIEHNYPPPVGNVTDRVAHYRIVMGGGHDSLLHHATVNRITYDYRTEANTTNSKRSGHIISTHSSKQAILPFVLGGRMDSFYEETVPPHNQVLPPSLSEQTQLLRNCLFSREFIAPSHPPWKHPQGSRDNSPEEERTDVLITTIMGYKQRG
ncbi:hypothetical protein CDAR_475971 [Caerostris darwini]|uniref:Uncharacterized protein n=1 Tax=Caerostris darwini TaxID=1538125 RepID=A0AAV4P855_9ARAC|nr:hypothetical protein CDAR_475971 [Caerostris darwini]